MTIHSHLDPPSHQIARLSHGRHRSPDQGVCVMELASMLAGERFSDSPQSVCPVVATFLRHYNDRVDDSRRQDLYAYAAMAVGTAGDREALRPRAQLCARLGEAYGASLSRRRRLIARWRPERYAASAAKVLAEEDSRHRVALLALDLLVGQDERLSEGGAPAVPDRERETASERPIVY